jgi:hypothetical protein
MSIPPVVRTGAAALALALILPALVGCSSNESAEIIGVGEAAVVCQLSASSVAAGSTEPVQVTVFVTRDGVGAPGERVQFETDRGDVAPDAVFTDPAGFATASFFPPSDPGGVAIITALLVDGRDEIVAECEVAITSGTSNPLLSVSLQTPPRLAGLTIEVGYDPSNVALPPGATQLLGEFAAGDCLSLVDDDGQGLVVVAVTCPTERTAAGSDAVRFAFENIGGTIVGISAFDVSCSGYDENGFRLPTLCQGRVTQL